jgi:hypothetical protein
MAMEFRRQINAEHQKNHLFGNTRCIARPNYFSRTLVLKKLIPMWEDVVSILLTRGDLCVGDVLRLRRCSRRTKYVIEHDAIYWKSLAVQTFEWKRRRPNANIIDALVNRCRECGNKNVLQIVTSKWNRVNVCTTCIQVAHGYSELFTRKQVKDVKNWSLRKMAKHLVPAYRRGGWIQKIFYWGHVVRNS